MSFIREFVNTYFYLYPGIRIIRGHKIDLLVDLERNIYFNVPKPINDIIESLGSEVLFEEMNDLSREFLQFLVDSNLGFYSQDSLEFNTNYYLPYVNCNSKISNCIIEYLFDENVLDIDMYRKFAFELESLNCKHILIKLFGTFNLTEFFDIASIFNNSSIHSIELYFSCPFNIDVDIFSKFKRISSVSIFSAEHDLTDDSNKFLVRYSELPISNFLCSNIDQLNMISLST